MHEHAELGIGRQIIGLAGWLVLTFCAPLCGAFIKIGRWYSELSKPSWNPPAWIFGPVWTTLYVMMAISAWMVWRGGGWAEQRRPLAFFLVQLALNALWTPLFFGLQRPGIAFAEIVLLALAVYATLAAFWQNNRFAAALLVPYALWTTFAAYLNFTLWRMNTQG